MPIKLLISSLIAILLIVLIIFYILKKGRIDIKYAIVWLFAFFLMAIMIIVPKLLDSITKLFGFTLSSNLIIVFFIAILIFINISLTIIVSGLNNKVRLLIQEISLLKKGSNQNEQKK